MCPIWLACCLNQAWAALRTYALMTTDGHKLPCSHLQQPFSEMNAAYHAELPYWLTQSAMLQERLGTEAFQLVRWVLSTNRSSICLLPELDQFPQLKDAQCAPACIKLLRSLQQIAKS